MYKTSSKYYLSFFIFLFVFGYSKVLLADSLLVGYWGYDEYLEENPNEKVLVSSFASVVKEKPRPLAIKQEKPIKITYVYPGKQVSDYWTRSLAAFESRLKELNIDYELTPISTEVGTDFEEQSDSLFDTLEKESDYLIFTLNNIHHRKFIEHAIQHPKTKVILQNITTPVKAWSHNQPLLYVGFDHVIGTRMLVDYVQKRFPDGAKYGMLYYSYGYLSTARGDTFVHGIDSKKYTLTSSFYTDATQESSYHAVKNMLNSNPEIDFIYSSSTDIALGAMEALDEVVGERPLTNGWGGGSLELEAIKNGKLDATIMRMNDDTGVAIAEAIKLDLEGKKAPSVYSGDFKIITSETSEEELNRCKRRAFRYSGIN